MWYECIKILIFLFFKFFADHFYVCDFLKSRNYSQLLLLRYFQWDFWTHFYLRHWTLYLLCMTLQVISLDFMENGIVVGSCCSCFQFPGQSEIMFGSKPENYHVFFSFTGQGPVTSNCLISSEHELLLFVCL